MASHGGIIGLVLFTLFVSPVILALEQVQRMEANTLPLIAGLLVFGALALIMVAEATAVVPPGWAFHVDRQGNVICARTSR